MTTIYQMVAEVLNVKVDALQGVGLLGLWRVAVEEVEDVEGGCAAPLKSS